MGARRATGRARATAATLAALSTYTSVCTPPLVGQDRFFRTYGADVGFSAPPVWALAQDRVGFIWVGAEGGLFRFDGAEIRRWDADVIPTMVMDVAASPSGGVAALDARGRLFEVSEGRTRPVALPWPLLDAPRRVGRTIAYDVDGALWLRYGDEVGTRTERGWTTLGEETFGGEAPTAVLATRRGGALVVTRTRLWRALPDGTAETLYTADVDSGEALVDAVEAGEGTLVLTNVGATSTPRVVEVGPQGGRELLAADALPPGRAIAMRERAGTIWIAADRYLAAARAGAAPEILGGDAGFESGGPLLVDREGSLWLGSYVGLHQYPEPDTRIWAERQGIPSRHTRFVTVSGGTVWAMTWDGPVALHASAAGWEVERPDWGSRSGLCTSPEGKVWTASYESLVELDGPTQRAWPGAPSRVDGCAIGRDGGVWMGGGGRLEHVDPAAGTRRMLTPPLADRSLDPRPALLHDAEDRLWVGAGPSLCRAPAGPLLRAGVGSWTCDEIAGSTGVLAVAEVGEGGVWAAVGPEGLLAWGPEGWSEVILPNVATGTVHALVPSPRGGVWVVGDGILLRATHDAGGEVEVVERLTPWHGIAQSSAGHLHESAEGDLWLATNQGLVQIPAAVRFAEGVAPRAALVEGRVDDVPVALDGDLVLPHDRNRIEIRFAALTFRDRAGLRHQVRLSPTDPWSDATGDPAFRWVDLRPGEYRAEYRASRDGLRWSETVAGLSFRVRPPWYASAWFVLLVAALAGGVVVVAYRARVAHLVGLERQRTRIAMDLHDQVGSGLASVGILSRVLTGDGLEADERRETAAEIAEVAEELGHSLSDIVWSLDPETASMEELASRLTEHAGRLFPDDRVEFTAQVSRPHGRVQPPVAVRRNVLLIGLEALHNAARHSGARNVVLVLEPVDSGRWSLIVRDDGGGLGGRDATGASGRGLEGMRRRAAAIGGSLTVDSSPGRGTAVALVFDPRGVEEPRLPGWMRAATLWARRFVPARRIG